jgi:hypothetical protein
MGWRLSQSLGTPIVRKEDPALLSGRGRYADDLPVPAGTLQCHVIRSPHPHADIVTIDAAPALAKDGVWAVITGADVIKISDPFLVALKSPIHQWSLAVDRVRFVGEPVALVVAESRYLAEDAAELVQIEYAPIEAVIDPLAACEPGSPILHAEAKTNEIKRAAWAEVERVQEFGGVIAALDYVKEQLVASHTERLQRINSGEQTVVGVNKFTETALSPLYTGDSSAILKVDEDAERDQLARLHAFRPTERSNQRRPTLVSFCNKLPAVVVRRIAVDGVDMLDAALRRVLDH